MNLISFFKKPKPLSETPLKKQALALPRRKTVQFEPQEKLSVAELDELLRSDPVTLLTETLPPANYYRDKRSWLECELYFNDDYTTAITRLVSKANERVVGATDFHEIDYDLLKALLRRFGQYIERHE